MCTGAGEQFFSCLDDSDYLGFSNSTPDGPALSGRYATMPQAFRHARCPEMLPWDPPSRACTRNNLATQLDAMASAAGAASGLPTGPLKARATWMVP